MSGVGVDDGLLDGARFRRDTLAGDFGPVPHEFDADAGSAAPDAGDQGRPTAYKRVQDSLAGFGEELDEPDYVGFRECGRMPRLELVALRRAAEPDALGLDHPLSIGEFVERVSGVD